MRKRKAGRVSAMEVPAVLTIRVTQEDIDQGCRGHAGSCPVARAVLRHADITGVVVSAYEMKAYFASLVRAFYALSRAATQFIKDFDAERPVAPATFRARLVESGGVYD